MPNTESRLPSALHTLLVRPFVFAGRLLWRDTCDLVGKIRRGSPPHLLVGAGAIAAYLGMSVQNHRVRAHEDAVIQRIESGELAVVDWTPGVQHGRVLVVNQRLGDLIAEMMRRSPTFARQMREVANSNMRVVIGDYGELGMDEGSSFSGEVIFVPSFTGLRAEGALMGIHLDMFDEVYAWLDEEEAGIDPGIVRDGEIMATIAHEFAHLYDVAKSGGNWYSVCRDPRRWQDDKDACVMKRENMFRKELGLPEDYQYGMSLPDKAATRYIEAGLGQ